MIEREWWTFGAVKWPIVEAVPAQPLAFWDRLFSWRKVPIHLRLGEARQLRLEDIQQQLTAVLRDPNWEWDGRVTADEIQGLVQAAESIEYLLRDLAKRLRMQ